MAENKNYNISIVVPVHNEELRVERGILRICEYFDSKKYDYEVIIAEDGSKDKTVELIEGLAKRNSRIIVISSSNRLGKGRAISEAMLHAKKDFVGYMDVDLAADPSEFERLIERIRDYDIAIGSRLLRESLPAINRPFYRTVTSFFYSRFYRILFHNFIVDPQCGFKLFKKDIIQKLFSEIKTTGFAFDSEVIVKAFSLDLRIIEVAIMWSHEKASKLKVSEQIQQMGKELIMIWYESHVLWLEGKKIYAQKRGSIFGKFLFWIVKMIKKD
jgi:glycosyltransferase involved in cell wall biosynthesis